MQNKGILIDSDVIIWFLRGKPEIVEKLSILFDSSHLFVSVITITEIFAGAKKSELKIIDGLFTSLGIIEINTKIAKLAGLFINEYRKNSMVETADALIASSAKINNLMFWTFNKKHYPMFNKEELL
ncbi:MAG: type II toxin-antitoxin system VapC family toxin [Bacteroidetes bacterium]|nr:type II toxin-antitoxin system VapC family toxin [Bacteroidota bacterium]MCH8325019.1 type II toxin-antitoxin system VapC family toxin [Bacteroidota bacterium]